MKKLLLSLLCVLLAFSLMACGGNNEPVTNPSESVNGQESTDAVGDTDSTAAEGEDTTTEGEVADTTEDKDSDTTKGEDATAGKDTTTKGEDATAGSNADTTAGKDSTTAGKDTTAANGSTASATGATVSGGTTATTAPTVSNGTTGKTDANKTTVVVSDPTKSQNTTKKTETTKPIPSVTDNVVDWGEVFGTETTTTTTTKKGETTTTTTTTTTAPTTTTTVPPTVAESVLLPAVGTDVDVVKLKGRIRISAIDLKDGKLTVKIKNESTGWITEETDYVKYACYDKDGNELKGTDEYYGYFYLGCLEVGDEETFTVNLPTGTAEVKLVDAKIVYWTEWK